jgi:hypothetical protein
VVYERHQSAHEPHVAGTQELAQQVRDERGLRLVEEAVKAIAVLIIDILRK